MQTKHKAWLILGILALLVAVTPASWAQFNSNQPTVNFNAVLGESLTVTASPGTVNFALATSGPAIGSSPIAITTAWALGSGRTSVNLVAYFTTASALTDGAGRSEEHTSELQSRLHLVCRLLLEKKKNNIT